MTVEVKAAALAYAAEGWPVLPLYTVRDGLCGCGTAACKSPGKHPVAEYAPHAAHSATLDLEAIAAWPEPINVGVACGAAAGDLMVFDIDNTEVAKALAHPQGGLTDKVGVTVTGRGIHLWFRTSGSTRGYLIRDAHEHKKIGDMRGDGQYVAAPPSVHVNGRTYNWLGLAKGTWTPRSLPLVTDSMEFVAGILDQVGITLDTERVLLTGVDVPNTAITAADLPEVLQSSGQLTDVIQALKGSVDGTNDPDRSGRLYGMAWRTFYESLVLEAELTSEALAGIVKRIDEQCYHKYTDRRDADKYYLLTAMMVLEEREKMLPRAVRSRQQQHQPQTSSGASQTGAQGPGAQQTYVWDDSVGTLFLRRGRDWPKVCNFYPSILADVEIDRGGEVSRAWQVRFVLKEGQYVEFFLPAEDRAFYSAMAVTFGKALPADFAVYPGMFDHVRMAMQELSKGKWEQRREFASSGWVAYGSDRVYLLPSAAGGIGPNGLDASVKINIDHLPEDEAIATPALANYGRGVRPPATTEETAAAWEAFNSLIQCGPADLTMGIALQVLAGPLHDAGAGENPPLVHVMGRTGTFKTSFCLTVLSMFGTFDESAPPPANWGSTPNSLQTMLHTTKDLTLLIDDFKSSTVRSKPAVIQLIQQYADGSVRQRQSLQQRLQPVQMPRGLILSNGEDVWEREASAEARTITIQVRRGDIEEERLSTAQAAVTAGHMQMFGALYLQWLARHPEIFEQREVSTKRIAWRAALRKQTQNLNVHLRLLSAVATLGAVGQVFYQFIGETYPEHQERVRDWITTTTRALATGARERAVSVEEASPFRQLARTITEAMTARQVCLWPAEGISEERPRIPDIPQAEVIGYWWGSGVERTVMLTQNTSFAWYRRQQLREGERAGFVWLAARNEAMDSYHAEARDRVRVVTQAGGDVRQLSGLTLPMSEFERAAGGAIDAAPDGLFEEHHNV